MNTRLNLKQKVCSICYQKIEIKGQLDDCKHQFCFECIKIWAEKENSCPVCRASFKKIKKARIRVNYCENKPKGPNHEVISVEVKKQNTITIPARDIIPFMIELFSLIGQANTFTLS